VRQESAALPDFEVISDQADIARRPYPSESRHRFAAFRRRSHLR